MNQIDNIMALAWELCRAAEESARMNCDREEDALRAAIEQALAVQPEKRPQNCGTGFCSCIKCPYSDHFPDAGKMTEREWVDLTYDEIRHAYYAVNKTKWAFGGMDDAIPFARAIEARLREKNGGTK